MKRKNLKILILAFFLLFSTFGLIPPVIGNPDLVTSREYTTTTDFEEGTLVGLDSTDDQLNLTTTPAALPFIWVPNAEGTVSKINTKTGDELGRYWVGPPLLPQPNPLDPELSSDPSRTTVDLQGNCWVGNRRAGTVVKIGLYEAGGYIDRNFDGEIQTSRDLNNDGDITGGELLPWGEDECVLFEVLLYETIHKGTYVPGTIPLTDYDTHYWRTSPRGLAVDAENNLWVGNCPAQFQGTIHNKYNVIDGDTGAILKTFDVFNIEGVSHEAYGAIIDKQGILWSSGRDDNHILKIDTLADPITPQIINLPHFAYGLALDYQNKYLFVSGWTSRYLSRINIATGVVEWSKYHFNIYQGRGVACTKDNDVWVVSSIYGIVNRFSNDGAYKGYISVGDTPTGVAVDDAGKVWVCNWVDENIVRINPAFNSGDPGYPVGIKDLVKTISGSGGHYSYSDMTGNIAWSVTTKTGIWTTVFNSLEPNTPWGKVSWNSSEPVGTEITVRVSSSDDASIWSQPVNVENGIMFLDLVPDGQYLKIETTLKITTGDESPILYDLTVNVGIIPATVDFHPKTLNRKSQGKWVTVYIELLDGYDVNNIDVSTVLLNGIIPAEDHPTGVGDYDGDGIPDLMVKFDRQEFIDTHDVGESIDITITGELFDGTPFEGFTDIRALF